MSIVPDCKLEASFRELNEQEAAETTEKQVSDPLFFSGFKDTPMHPMFTQAARDSS